MLVTLPPYVLLCDTSSTFAEELDNCALLLLSSCDSTLKVFFFPHRIHRIDLIELLLAHGAELRAVDGSNQTAADVALFYNHEHVVKYLASRGGK
jgi:ankyrin repeat protein